MAGHSSLMVSWLLVVLLAGIQAAVGQGDGKRADDDTVVTLMERQAQTINALQARLTALETQYANSMQTMDQRIQQLEQELTSVRSQMPAVTSVTNTLNSMQTLSDTLAFQLAYHLTTDAGLRSAIVNMPNGTQILHDIFPIRLENGTSNAEGRIAIKIGNSWGVVCDDLVTDDLATVVCNQLGFPSGHATHVPQSRFGEGTGLTFLDNVVCVGSEPHLLLCPSNPLLNENCAHHEDEGVLCLPCREQRDEYCFLVIGKSGNGKSRLSNAIAGDSRFPVGRGMVTTTRKARLETVYTSHGNIQVVDTPDITNCGMNTEEMRKEVSEWHRLTQPYSTTAILTVRCDVRYTAEEYAIYTKIAELWADNSLRKKLVVAFTFGECQDNPLEEELKTVCKELKSVLRDANDTWFLVDYTKGDDFRGKAIDAAQRAAQGRPCGTEIVGLVSALIVIAVFSRRFITAIVLYSLGTALDVLQKLYEVTCDTASFVYRGVRRVFGWMVEKVFGRPRESEE